MKKVTKSVIHVTKKKNNKPDDGSYICSECQKNHLKEIEAIKSDPNKNNKAGSKTLILFLEKYKDEIILDAGTILIRSPLKSYKKNGGAENKKRIKELLDIVLESIKKNTLNNEGCPSLQLWLPTHPL